ncbi:hypothetical protein LEP1GSC202_2806 [Leptospira yanagawae serovar Saopaulo str. Sao Paulo = ATCC 700523]|uniref:Glycosyl transferase n=2 Tax=Leptospira yanagawae TaxID=293069 RepID=A0ABY2M094_9LEPT|nr:hypothetical protein [Leptospira yanagawae]EOQ88743.1 hypothetical protein LEP1GSC202_2806 [Leptospira yanagawae serovar Saopaulo str. Sao Paulo = ATCC 700523]TGL19924.1 hypothetical protein EHQ46_11055 [Leptospira yanagawae]
MLSIIVPTDIDENIYYKESLLPFQKHKDVEIILIPQKQAFTRAERINVGFHRSNGELILLHHPRTKLPKDAINFLIGKSKTQFIEWEWGGFLHSFDKKHFFLNWISWYSNEVRVRRKGIVYFDHCIFFHRNLWKKDLSPRYLFEDTELSQNLLKQSKPILLPFRAMTSAHRFIKNGIYKQTLLNFFLKIGNLIQLPSSFLFSLYQK